MSGCRGMDVGNNLLTWVCRRLNVVASCSAKKVAGDALTSPAAIVNSTITGPRKGLAIFEIHPQQCDLDKACADCAKESLAQFDERSRGVLA